MDVVILAAGRGERMLPLTLDRPKTLLPVCNVPILARLLASLDENGICGATVTLPPLLPASRELLDRFTPIGFDLTVIESAEYKGTFQRVLEVRRKEAATTLVIYGDSLLSADLSALLRFHEARRAEDGILTLLHHYPDDLRVCAREGRTYHGVVGFDEQGRANRFLEKPPVSEVRPGFDSAVAPVFVCDRALFEHPVFATADDFAYNVLEPAVNDLGLATFTFDIAQGFRLDLGNVQQVFDANLRVLRGELPLPIPGDQVSPGVWVGADTTWEQADLTPPVLLGQSVQLGSGVQVGPNAIIGDNCRLDDDSSIRDTLLFVNCTLGAGVSLHQCVIGADSTIAAGAQLPPGTVFGPHSAVGSSNFSLKQDKMR